MHMLSKIAVAAGCALALSSGLAQANAIYSFDNAALTNGDTVSGILETNQYGYFGTANLALKDSTNTVLETFSFPAPNVNVGGTMVQVFDGYNNSLFLYFDNSIDGYGPVSLVTTESFLCTSSFALDCGGGTYGTPAGPQTFFSAANGNDVLGVPEPSGLWLLTAGLGGLLTFVGLRRRKAAV
jgi:hypothetical protein